MVPVRISWIGWASLGLLLAAPRIARLAYPQVWIEDDAYLHGAFMLSRGLLPYRDFPLPHPPLLEGMIAAIFLVAPVTVRSAEVFTQAFAFAGSALVFAVGRRLADTATGTSAALVFATSSLLFRYHLFEREVFVVVPTLAAVLVTLNRDESERPVRAMAAGVLIAAAMAIKLTAIAAGVAVVVYLAMDGRRRPAIAAAATAGVVAGAFAVILWARFGTDFVVQVLVFRAVHAAFPSLGVKLDEMRYTMDVSLALGAGGVALIVWRREARRWAAPLTQLAIGLVVLVLLNPTYWAHTGIELLPWLSLAAGYQLTAIVRALAPSARRRGPALACLGASVVLLMSVVPIRNLNWEAGDSSVYGFGYRDRNELETMGRSIRERSSPDALVAVPPILAFIANRREAVPYAEIAGTIDELTAAVRRGGYWSAVRAEAAHDLSFWESVEASRDRMEPALEAALAAHRVAVVINDSPDDLGAVPLVHLSQETLERNRYTLESVTAHYEAWIPNSQGTRLTSQR